MTPSLYLMLSCAVLCCAVLCCAVLCCAVLCCAVMSCADNKDDLAGAQHMAFCCLQHCQQAVSTLRLVCREGSKQWLRRTQSCLPGKLPAWTCSATGSGGLWEERKMKMKHLLICPFRCADLLLLCSVASWLSVLVLRPVLNHMHTAERQVEL